MRATAKVIPIGTKAKAKDKTPDKVQIATGTNYDINRLKSGKIQVRIRSTKYGNATITRPVGTSVADAHKIARNALQEMANNDTPELAKNVLKKFTLNQLIEEYKKTATIGKSDISRVKQFQKDRPDLCAKTLDKHGEINKGFDDYVNDRQKSNIIGYTLSGKVVYGSAYNVTRQMSPLRTMYRNAGSQKLYGLLDYRVTLRSAFEGIQFPKDVSGRKQKLERNEERFIYGAIETHIEDAIERIKWLTLVETALITCLRRGVLLHLKWRDVDFDNKWIKVSKSYWKGDKRAPEYVPVTDKLEQALKRYSMLLSEIDKKPDCLLFVGVKVRKDRARNGQERQNDWIDSKWSEIIRLTNLCKDMETSDGEKIYDAPKGGNVVKDWFHFHDLRATGESKYALKPYNLNPEEYGYLMGHLGRKTKTQDKYDRDKQGQCNEIREKINNGDAINARGMQTPDGKVPSPFELSSKNFTFLWMIDNILNNKERAMRTWMETVDKEEAIKLMYMVKAAKEAYNHFAPTMQEDWKYSLSNAIELNKPRDHYERRYGIYPEIDPVMQAYEASNRTGKVDQDRVALYLECMNKVAENGSQKASISRNGREKLMKIAELMRQIDQENETDINHLDGDG